MPERHPGSPLEPLHRASHASLLARPSTPAPHSAAVNAIIVPTSRSASRLTHAMQLAAEHGCTLLVLCSKRSSANATVALAAEFEANVVAVDIMVNEVEPPTRFVTSHLLRDTRFHSDSDLSFKRNLGLALARLAGWNRILFLDDDMRDVGSAAVADAGYLLDAFDVVGLQNNGFPDNSVLCHAYRAIGGKQDTFIGGGALAVATDRVHSFFPNVYNEDWLFMLASVAQGRVAVTGTARQERYDPFASPRRARYEEFGDCLAEGLYYLLDTEGTVAGADGPFWQRFIVDRRRLITKTIAALSKHVSGDERRARTLDALRASWKSNVLLTPHGFERYLANWRSDGERWRSWIDGLGRVDGIEKALSELGLAPHVPGPRAIAALPVAHCLPTATDGQPAKPERTKRDARWRPGFMVNSFSRLLARHVSNTLTD